MASEIETLLEEFACDFWDHEVEMTFASRGHLIRALKLRLLPLLEAGSDMRYQEWPVDMAYGPAKDWDDALAAAKKG